MQSEAIELTPRQIEIINLICKGYTSKEIAENLHIAKGTVQSHRTSIYRVLRKFGIRTQEELICFANENMIWQKNTPHK